MSALVQQTINATLMQNQCKSQNNNPKTQVKRQIMDFRKCQQLQCHRQS